MGKLLLTLLRFASEKLRWLVLIIVVLLLASWLKHEWQALEKTQQFKQQQQQAQALVQKRHAELLAAQQKTAQISQQLLNELDHKKNLMQRLQLELNQLREQRQALWDEHWLTRKNPLSETSQQLREYNLKISVLSGQLKLSQQAYSAWQQKVISSPEIAKNRQLLSELAQSQQVLNQLSTSIIGAENSVNSSLVKQLKEATIEILPIAISVLLSLIFIPILLKIVLYFGIAPLASALPAIRLLAEPSNPQLPTINTGHISSHSLKIDLAPTQELLLHPDYLQSFSQNAQKSTQWFLNPSIPLTSWAAGLVTLVRLRGEQSETIQLASMYHAFEELVIIDIPQGASMVCKPRGLVGVIKSREQPVHISKHWRLLSLHGWLTLQLRYLVFHGACQLIIKGSGGVVIEQATQPRLIQQNATLGFSSHVAYSNYRCETFISYYLGKDALFNDRFSGASGIYFYEQSPHHQTPQNHQSQKMGGVWDAVLKVFGI